MQSAAIQANTFQVLTEKQIHRIIQIGFVYRPANHGLLLVREGSVHFRYNLQDYFLEKNALLFVLPNSVYEFVHISEDAKFIGTVLAREFLEQSSVYLGGTSVVNYFSSGIQPHYVLDEEDVSVLLGMLQTMEIKLKTDDSAPYHRQIVFFLLLAIVHEAASIYRKYNSVYKSKLSRKQEVTVGFFQLLSTYCKEERSVLFYAESLFVTPKHLTEILKSVTGKKAGELIDQAVILEAKVLLRNPGINISQTADSLHFSDPFFFSKFFKKHTGLTPSQYRSQV